MSQNWDNNQGIRECWQILKKEDMRVLTDLKVIRRYESADRFKNNKKIWECWQI